MTEIDDLSQLFGQQPRLTPAQAAHIHAVQEFEKKLLLERMSAVAFLAPILCNCSMYYDRESPAPPQVTCPVHGVMMSHPYTGQPLLPGMPVQPAMFTPEAGETHPQEGNDEER